jgi:hypothetical protein
MKPIDAICAALALPDAVRSDLDRLLGSDALDVARRDPPRVSLAVDALVALRRPERHVFEVEATTALARLAGDAIKRRGVSRESNPFSMSADAKGEAALRRLLSLGLTEKDLNDQ